MSKAVDQTHSKKHTDSYLPQTNILISRGTFCYLREIVFLKIFVYITNGELCTHDMVSCQLVMAE